MPWEEPYEKSQFKDDYNLFIKRGQEYNMLAGLDTEIGGFPCFDIKEGHERESFKLETLGKDGCV